MIPGPLFLVALPLALAPVVFVLRRWALPAAFLASATAFVMASLCLGLPFNQPVSVLGWKVALDQPLAVLGREFSLELAGCSTLGFIYSITAVAFLFAWRVSQGCLFFPLGLIILSLLGAAVMVRLLLFAVLFLWIASIVAVFIIQGSGRGALQYLVMMSLAILPLLLALGLIDVYAINPDNLALLRYATVLLALGFAVLLAVVPFHGWVSAVAADAPPVVAAFVFSATNAVVLLRLLNLLHSCSWLAENPQVFSLLRLGGLLMVAIGGLLAFAQREFGRLLGYAVLSDMGCTLVALSVASPAALTATLLQVVHRAVGLMLAAMGLSVVRRHAGSDAFTNLGGVARQLPVSTAGLILGGLSLAGMPLTAGFPGRWAIYRILPASGLAVAMLLSGAGIALGYLHGLSTLLGHANEQSTEREPLIASIMIGGTMVLCIGLGLRPQWLLPTIQRVAEGFGVLR